MIGLSGLKGAVWYLIRFASALNVTKKPSMSQSLAVANSPITNALYTGSKVTAFVVIVDMPDIIRIVINVQR